MVAKQHTDAAHWHNNTDTVESVLKDGMIINIDLDIVINCAVLLSHHSLQSFFLLLQ